MIIVGLTGGVGTGKSTVAGFFAQLGAYIIDWDELAREVVCPHSRAWKRIIECFGKDVLNEDLTINRQKLAKIVLTKAGHRVTLAHNGQEAVEKFTTSSDQMDLIFMDVQMPEMDGMEATRKIRESGFDVIPIVAMTANAMKGDREKCINAGMNDFITKPIKKEIVLSMVEKWVCNDA